MLREKFDPLNKKNLGISVADAAIEQPLEPLAEMEPFDGAGIYALYYFGDFEPYLPIVAFGEETGIDWPIYVGKAIPPGSRKGEFGLDPDPGRALYKRIREHRRSIEAAENLDIGEFSVRCLLVDDIWIPLGEALLISRFCPAWNQAVDGFGIHAPGAGRHAQAPSDWDVLHPGRPWVERLTGTPRPSEDIIEELAIHLATTSERLKRREPADPE